ISSVQTRNSIACPGALVSFRRGGSISTALLAAPGLLTVQLTPSAGEPEAGLGEVALGEGQDLRGGDREDERIATVVAEHAIPHLEVPVAVVLRPPRFRQMDQQLLVGDRSAERRVGKECRS